MLTFTVFLLVFLQCVCFEFQNYILRKQNCSLTRIYHPSVLEKKWIAIIDSVAETTVAWLRGCRKIKEDASKIDRLLQYQDIWKNNTSLEWCDNGEWKDTLSYFEVSETCGNTSVTREVPIEPLIGFLRHPAFHCYRNTHGWEDKSYMFLLNNQQIFPRVKRGKLPGKKYLFDLGASLYAQGAGGASQQWFIDQYSSRGIEFDRILAWEVEKHEPKKIFNDYTPKVIGKISYFNVPAEMNLHDIMSPIRILKDIVHSEDFLVLKIDIDNEELELGIIYSFISDTTVTDLIDEFFFEHHVSLNPMEHYAWGHKDKVNNITESYQLFGRLRNAGIRAHSWV